MATANQSPATPAKRGRKPGTPTLSLADRVAKKTAALNQAKEELRELEKQAAARRLEIVGRVVLTAAAEDPEARAWLASHLRAAKLNAADKAEIAPLLVE